MANLAEPRFCDQCGRSLVPLPVPHVVRSCDECGKAIHVAEPGEGGEGILVREGDKFTIPEGWLTISLDPRKARGRLTRAGISWLSQQLLVGRIPRDHRDIGELLQRYEAEADEVLKASEGLDGLNLADEEDARKAMELLANDKYSLEWWAFSLKVLVQRLPETMAEAEPDKVAMAGIRLQAVRSMFVFAHDLEEPVWLGYKQLQATYDVAAATASTRAEADAIQAVRSKFEDLSEDVLHAWVEAGVEIGPRLGVSDVAEDLLKALARFHLLQFERRRSEKELDMQHRSGVRKEVVAAVGVTAVVATAVVGVLKAVGVL